MAGAALVPLKGIAQTPIAASGALEVATVGYGARADDEIRSVFARVSRWTDEASAAAFQEYLAGEAGSDLPEGEFYHSEVVEWAVPDAPDDLVVTAMEWSTTVGVAAYHTAWVLCTMRRGPRLWDLWISGAGSGQVRELATDLMTVLGERYPPPCGTLELEDYLPRPEDVPAGMSVVDYPSGVTPDGEPWLDIPEAPLEPPATPADTGCGAPE